MVLQGTIGAAPRYLMEAIAFGAIVVLVLYLLATNHDLGNDASDFGSLCVHRVPPDAGVPVDLSRA